MRRIARPALAILPWRRGEGASLELREVDDRIRTGDRLDHKSADQVDGGRLAADRVASNCPEPAVVVSGSGPEWASGPTYRESDWWAALSSAPRPALSSAHWETGPDFKIWWISGEIQGARSGDASDMSPMGTP
jgi:hypothetical protein